MRLQLSTFAEEHKNILRAQKKRVMMTLGLIIAYLIDNQEVSSGWRELLLQEQNINYYDVIPKGSRLQPKEIELEMLVTNNQGIVEATVFKKNTASENTPLISLVEEKLRGRIQRLITLGQTAPEEQREFINQHIQHTENLLQECFFLKINSQILICEVGALHYMNKITLQMEGLMNQSSEEYLYFKTLLRELEHAIKRQAPAKRENANVISYTRHNVETTRQQFNNLFNQLKSLCFRLCFRQLVSSSVIENIQESFSDMQYMFFAKNDVNFSISK